MRRRYVDPPGDHEGRCHVSPSETQERLLSVEATYGPERTSAEDIALVRQGFGAWHDPDVDGATWVDQRRSGTRPEERDA